MFIEIKQQQSVKKIELTNQEGGGNDNAQRYKLKRIVETCW